MNTSTLQQDFSGGAGMRVALIGGGNMASAIVGGLLGSGMAAAQLLVVEPHDETAQRLQAQWGLQVLAAPDAALAEADWVVWAVKPQVLAPAAQQARPYVGAARQLSVAAGIPSESLARWLGTEQVVRAMPNTPALVGRGMTGLYARPAVSAAARTQVEQLIAPTGQWLWLEDEAQLDAVTALSGSGPAYVFYFLQAMVQAGTQLGLSAEQARHLAQATFDGATHLATRSEDSLDVLRERVTSKGGTTHAALSHLQAQGVNEVFVQAMHAAHARAVELALAFGAA